MPSISQPALNVISHWSGSVAFDDKSQSDCARDLRALGASIRKAHPQDVSQDIEVLANFASRRDAGGEMARGLLRDLVKDLYGDPTARSKRDALANAAYMACKSVFDDQGADRDKVLSLPPSLVYTGAKVADPKGDAYIDHAKKYFDSKFESSGIEGLDGKYALDDNRMVEAEEVLAACRQLKSLPVETTHATMSPKDAKEQEAIDRQFTAVAEKALACSSPVAIMVHSGKNSGFPHWMPVVAQPNRDGTVTWHVIDTDSDKPGAQNVSGELENYLLARQEGPVQPHRAPMQENAANACGPLSHHLLAKLDALIAASGPNIDVGKAIDAEMKAWMDRDPSDQQAGARAARAGMYDATAAALQEFWSIPSAEPIPLPAADVRFKELEAPVARAAAPATDLAQLKKMRAKFDAQEFAASISMHDEASHSIYDAMSEALVHNIQSKDPKLSEMERHKHAMAGAQMSHYGRPGAKPFMDSAIAFTTKAGQLQSRALINFHGRYGSNPLKAQQEALSLLGTSALEMVDGILIDQAELLEKCHQQAWRKDTKLFAATMDDIVRLQDATAFRIDYAIEQLNKTLTDGFRLTLAISGASEATWHQIQKDAEEMIAALRELRKCVTGKIDAAGAPFTSNVLTDLVEFARWGKEEPQAAMNMFFPAP